MSSLPPKRNGTDTDVRQLMDNLPEVTKKPCAECPWRREAERDYLGPHTAGEWVELAHTDSPIACHLTINGLFQDWSELRQCAGAAIFRANVYKTPRHPKVAKLPRDEATVFASDEEFIEHHTKGV
jgi:hypothetical protein